MATVDWVTTTQVKDALGKQGTGMDTRIAAAITAASRALNRRCQHEFTPKTTSATRRFSTPYRPDPREIIFDLAPYDLRTATTVKLHPEDATPITLVANEDYALLPVGGNPVTGAYQLVSVDTAADLTSTFSTRFGQAQLEIAGAWGCWDTADVPEDIKRACIVTVGAWIDKAVAEYGVDFGEEPRAFQPSMFSAYAIPMGAVSILNAARLIRQPILG